MGPPISHRIGKEEVIELLSSSDMRLNNSMQFADVFYGLVVVRL